MYMAERIVSNIFMAEKQILEMQFYPSIGFLHVDDRPYMDGLFEAIYMGQYMGGMGGSDAEQWGVYKVFDFHLPSQAELAHMKAIFIPGAFASVFDLNSQPWLPLLTRFIQNVYENHPHIHHGGPAQHQLQFFF